VVPSGKLYSNGIKDWLHIPEKPGAGSMRIGLVDKLSMLGANKVANDVSAKALAKEAAAEVGKSTQLQPQANKALWQRMVGLESTPFKCALVQNRTSNHRPSSTFALS
jgi:hypothetical protein